MTDAGDDTVETKWVLIGNKEGEGRFVVEDGGMDVRSLGSAYVGGIGCEEGEGWGESLWAKQRVES